MDALRPDEVVAVDLADARRIWTLARQLEFEYRLAEVDADLEAELGSRVVGTLPPALLARVHRFRNRGSAHDTLLVRGLLPPELDLEPTPGSAVAPRRTGARRATLCLLGAMSLLGEPFTFANLYQGRLVQDVVPAPGAEDAQTSEGSRTFLEWHVEDAFSDDRCDYFGLLCLRGDAAASTLVAPARRIGLDDRWTRVLRQPRFAVCPDAAHGLANNSTAVAVLTGDADDPELRFDPVYMAPLDVRDHEARQALNELGEAIAAAAARQVLEPGDLLIVDNRRAAHARTPFQSRFDGHDRWLLRAMVCASLPRHRRRGAARAI